MNMRVAAVADAGEILTVQRAAFLGRSENELGVELALMERPAG